MDGIRARLWAGACLWLVACAPAQAPVKPTAPPPPRPTPTAPAEPSAASRALEMYYARVQADLLTQGLLRTDAGGEDAPFTDRMLADNFLRVALYDEYTPTATGLVQRESVSQLRRWVVPVRVGLRFGPSVPAEQAATDRARIASYLQRLARLTGHPIALSDASPNFWLHVVNEDERRALGPVIRTALPELSGPEVAGLTDLPRSTYCIVYALSAPGGAGYDRAFAVIRAEHPDLLRLSCLHEEIAQGLGLANDSPRARPSIFNDDEEYALLTRQDELMLRILYSPELRPGMSLAEAEPIVRMLAARLMGASTPGGS